MTTIAKPNAKNFETAQAFLDADTAYNQARVQNGRDGGRAGHSPIEFWQDFIIQCKNAGLTRKQMEKVSGKAYQNMIVASKKNGTTIKSSAFSRAGQEKRFGTWTNARRLALNALDTGMIKKNGAIDGRTLAKDVRRVAQAQGVNVLELTRADYKKFGRFNSSTVERRFGGWAKAREVAFDAFVNHDWDDLRVPEIDEIENVEEMEAIEA